MTGNKEVVLLFDQLEKWYDCEGTIPEEQWSKNGIVLLRKILVQQPDNVECRYTLGKLLLAKGQDEKMQWRNYDAAYELFSEVLALQPESFRAHYHLGSIAKSYERWQEALDHFAKAIASPLLENFERVFALCAGSQCWIQLGDEQKAAEAIATAKEMAVERTERSHVELVEQSLLMHRSDSTLNRRINRPYVLVNNTGETLITAEEATATIDGAREGVYLVLDWRERKLNSSEEWGPNCARGKGPVFTGPHDTVQLESRVADLLNFLLTNPGYLSSLRIQQTFWPGSHNSAIVKRYINKLRTKLWSCFQINTDEIIKNVPDSGYRWCSELPYRIIKPISHSMDGNL